MSLLHKKIKLKDSWGNYTYFLDKDEIKRGDELSILFPDGTMKVFKVKSRHIYNEVTDWGHEDIVKTYAFYIEIVLYGMKIHIPLEKLKAWKFQT